MFARLTRPVLNAIRRPMLLAFAYLATAVIGLAATRDTNGLAALWPSDALLLAALLLRPAGAWRYIAWCACAAFAANLWFGASAPESLVFAVASIGGAIAGAGAGRLLGVGPASFERPAGVIRFCATTLAAAAAGATIAALPAFVQLGPGSSIWLSFFLSDLLGMLVFTPLGLMLAWARHRAPAPVRARAWEAPVLLAAVLAVVATVFLQSSYPLLFLPVAPMMLIAYRLGPTGTAAGIIVIAAFGTTATLAGHGPVALAAGSIAVHVHFLQFYLATLFAICLPMAAALAHRDRLAGIVRVSEARHRRIVERSRTVIFETDRAGLWTFLNPAWTALTGRETRSSLGESMLEAVAPEDRRDLFAALRPLAAAGGEVSHELRFLDARGGSRWALATVFPLLDGDGTRVGYHGTIEDVTERRAANAAIVESEHRYRLLADNSSDLILRIGLDGRLRYASPAADRLLGLSPDAMRDRSLLAGVAAADQDRLREACTALLQGAPDQVCTYRQTRADGTVIWLESAIQLLRDDTHRPAEFIAAVRDVSRRKMAETEANAAVAALRENHRLLSLAGRVSRVGHWRIDPHEERPIWSDEVFRIHGVTGGVAPKLDDAIDFYHTDDRAMISAHVAAALERGKPFEFSARIIRTDGALRHVLSNGQVERNASGDVTGVFGVLQDVTERTLAEIDLRASEQRFRAITEQAGDLITLHDTDGTALFVSPAAQAVLARDPSDVIGTSAFDWVIAADRVTLAATRIALLADPTRASRSDRVRVARGDGVAWIEVSARLTDIAGAARVVAVWRDVTDQVEREAELRTARAEAEAALSAKAEFLANMSHEIRTPMNGVIGFTELLLGSALDDEQRHHAQLIAESGEAMMKLLNDILDLSKIDAGRLDVVAEPLDPAHTLAGCVRLVAASAEQKGLALTLDLASDLPRAMLGDALRIRQVVLNLLGNAVKFTANGGVTLSARRNRRGLTIAVTDTGIGIASERQSAIFDQFVQADHSITRAYGGSGLGLAISNRLATLMGGVLSLRSEPGHGTTITLDLPLEEADAASLPARATPAPAHRVGGIAHILLADDHDLNQILVTAMLTRAGHRVTIARDGAEAVRRVGDAITTGAPLDLVLMDMQMPVMDGLSATRAIRALGGAATTLPIVALTANAFTADLDACRAAGMDDHLAKPIAAERLLAAIDRLVPALAPPRRSTFVPNASLAARFAEQKAATLAAVDTLIRTGHLTGTDLDDLATSLHKLAGTAAMFGEAELGDRARTLEGDLAGHDEAAIRLSAERVRAAA